jgi:aspartate dehydrogenase
MSASPAVGTPPPVGVRVRVLGVGAMGGSLVRLLQDGDVRGCTLAGTIRTGAETSVQTLAGTDVLVEAAGAEAARVWVPLALAGGIDVVLCSCGVLADPDFVADLVRVEAVADHSLGEPGRRRLGKILVPSGAIGGLDLFAAASRADEQHVDEQHLDERHLDGPPTDESHAARGCGPGAGSGERLFEASVVLTTTKSPAALDVATDTPVEVFRGSARAAALAHPKTANVAVALALATVGMDAVTVVMIADPAATRTRHVVTMTSPMGEYEVSVTNTVAPGSGGRTSAVTPWSVVTLLEALAAGHGAGLLVRPATASLPSRPPMPSLHHLEDTR